MHGGGNHPFVESKILANLATNIPQTFSFASESAVKSSLSKKTFSSYQDEARESRKRLNGFSEISAPGTHVQGEVPHRAAGTTTADRLLLGGRQREGLSDGGRDGAMILIPYPTIEIEHV
jgi:hypothetical protein